jgi:septum site-determining protein MinC
MWMAKDNHYILLGKPRVTLLRGRLEGLEVTLAGRDLAEAVAELEARLGEQPSFYRGSSAVANFGDSAPSQEDVTHLRGVLSAAGITLRALCGNAPELPALASAQGLAFDSSGLQLSESAQSLVADFAGARKDIAQRRRRGETSVRRAKVEPERARSPELRLVETGPSTLYHTATLRGGQTLHHTGNIVVIGDVNPGAELVATGDIVVFGRLAGIAHAGAGGDENARIFAVQLAPTQLRIARFIASDDRATARGAACPEAAVVRDGQIVALALDALAQAQATGASSA